MDLSEKEEMLHLDIPESKPTTTKNADIVLEFLETSFLKFAEQILRELEIKVEESSNAKKDERIQDLSYLISSSFDSLKKNIETITSGSNRNLLLEKLETISFIPSIEEFADKNWEKNLRDLKMLYYSLFESIIEDLFKKIDLPAVNLEKETPSSQSKCPTRVTFEDQTLNEKSNISSFQFSKRKKSISSGIHSCLSPRNNSWEGELCYMETHKSAQMIGSPIEHKPVPNVILVQKFLDILERLIRSQRLNSQIMESDWAELIIAMSENKNEKIELSLKHLKEVFQLSSKHRTSNELKKQASLKKVFAFGTDDSHKDSSSDKKNITLMKAGPSIKVPEQFKKDICLKGDSVIQSLNRFCSYAFLRYSIKNKEGKHGFSVKILSVNSCCGIGFADKRLIRSGVISLYDKKGAYMFYRNSLSIDGKFKNWGLSPVSQGCVVTILVDFEKGSISVFINNKFEGQENLEFDKSIKFYPVVEFYSNNQEVAIVETY